MNKCTRFAALVLALALLASLLPVVSTPAKAADRMNPTVNNGILTWKPLDGATRYSIYWEIDNWSSSKTSYYEDMVSSTTYNLQAAMDTDAHAYSGNYTIKIYAYRNSSICTQVEWTKFVYQSPYPALETPTIWFEGATVCWDPVEHASEYSFAIQPGSSPTAFYTLDHAFAGTTKQTWVEFSDFIEPDLCYIVHVDARTNSGSGYKWSRRGSSLAVFGADLLAGFCNKPRPLSGGISMAAYSYVGMTKSFAMWGDVCNIPLSELHYQWQRKSGGNWADISGATESTYTVQAEDVAAGEIRVAVSGNVEHGYTGTLFSNICYCIEGIPLTEDYFPDFYFLQYLKDKFDTDGNEVLESNEIYKIRTLSLNVFGESYNEVASLEGLKYLPYVENIHANHTKITSFDGSVVPDLAVLELSECPLESLNLSENACMRELYLSNLTVELRNPDLSGMPELRILETYGCKISILDVSKNPYLVEAALYGEVKDAAYSSRIYEISRFQYLRTDGYDSNITVAHFSEAFPNACFRNILQGSTGFNWDGDDCLSIAEAKNIVNLDVGDHESQLNNLKGIELLPNLEFLAAYNNTIQSVNLSRKTKLSYLDLAANRLYILDVSHNQALEQLYCNYNELALLNLGSNNALRLVQADGNRLMGLDVAGLPALEELKLSNNELTALRLSGNQKLKKLSCYGNKITELNISACPNLISAYKGTRTERTDADTRVSYWHYQKDSGIWLNIDKGVSVETEGPQNPFVDVHESDFFFNPVMWAVENGVTGGTDETHFSPYNTVQRCDSMVFFWAAKGRPAHADIQSPFKDVKKKHWFYDAVLWAVENSITAGTNATHFSPNNTCSRSEILQFLYAAMNRPSYSISNPYSDVKPKHWYYDGAIWAYENGLEHGENGKFNAKTPCTRGYVVTYLYRFITGKELAQ